MVAVAVAVAVAVVVAAGEGRIESTVLETTLVLETIEEVLGQT